MPSSSSVVQSILDFLWGVLLAYWNLLLAATGLGGRDAAIAQKKYSRVFDGGDKNDDGSDDGSDDDGSYRTRKATRIEQCLRLANASTSYSSSLLSSSSSSPRPDSVDLWELRELALSRGGLLNAKYRQQAWPLLVGLRAPLPGEDGDGVADDPLPDLTKATSNSTDDGDNDDGARPNNVTAAARVQAAAEQDIAGEEKKSEIDVSLDMIRRDVGRSVIFRYGRKDDDEMEKAPSAAAEKLARVLEGAIQQQSEHQSHSFAATLYYYQGLHDIAGVILHHMEYQVDRATKILSRISHSHLRDAMRENFGNITWLLSVILEPLVERIEPNVHHAIQTSQVDLANICLPWVITWFSHDLHDPDTAGRLADAFLSGHALLPVYFAVALLTHPILKRELIDSDCDDPSAAFLLIKKMPLALSLESKKKLVDSDGVRTVPIQEVLDDSLTIM